MEYTIHKQTATSAELLFVDPESGITHSRTINIADCENEAQIKERAESHLRAFAHRVKVGAITQSSLPVADVPADVVAPATWSAEAKAALEIVVLEKTVEAKTSVEEQIAAAEKEEKPTAELEAKLAKLNETLGA